MKIEFARLGHVQIDTGRVGGITDAKLVANHAASRVGGQVLYRTPEV